VTSPCTGKKSRPAFARLPKAKLGRSAMRERRILTFQRGIPLQTRRAEFAILLSWKRENRQGHPSSGASPAIRRYWD
jgi:hypothetical protein